MEILTIVAILLGIIAIFLNMSINEQIKTRDLLEERLFDKDIPARGLLNELGYLKHIDKKLEKIQEVLESKKLEK